MSSRDILVNVGEDQTVAITVFNNEISLEYLKKSFDRVKTLVYYKKDNIMCYMPMESDIFLLPPSQNEFVLIRNEKVAEDSPQAVETKGGDRFLKMLGQLNQRLEEKKSSGASLPPEPTFKKRNILVRWFHRDYEIHDDFVQFDAKICPVKIVVLDGLVNYTYELLKEEIIDQYVTKSNLEFFAGAEIELANCENEIFGDLKAGNILVRGLRRGDVPFWVWVRTKLRSAGKRCQLHLLTLKNSNKMEAQESHGTIPSPDYSSLTHNSSSRASASANASVDSGISPASSQESTSSRTSNSAYSQIKSSNKHNKHALTNSVSSNQEKVVSSSPRLSVQSSIAPRSSQAATSNRTSNSAYSQIKSSNKHDLTNSVSSNQAKVVSSSARSLVQSGIAPRSSQTSTSSRRSEHVYSLVKTANKHSVSKSSAQEEAACSPEKQPRQSPSLTQKNVKNVQQPAYCTLQKPIDKSFLSQKKPLTNSLTSLSEPASPIRSGLALLKGAASGIHQRTPVPITVTSKSKSAIPTKSVSQNSGPKAFEIFKDKTNLSSDPASDQKHSGGLALLKSRAYLGTNSTSKQPFKEATNQNISPDASKLVNDGHFKVPRAPKNSTLQELQLKIPYNVELGQIVFPEKEVVLGRGGQGCVRRASWINEPCAVKEMSISDDIKMKQALKELHLLSYVNHTNVVRLLGVAPEVQKLHLILEFVDGYNLMQVVFNNKLPINDSDKHYISIKTCNVLNYLHRNYMGKPSICHADLKPHNILIGKERMNGKLVVKICDFGMSKCKDLDDMRKSTTTGIAGTWSYMAPEQLLKFQQTSKETDVWSLGCTLKELYAKQYVWPSFDLLEIAGMMKVGRHVDLSGVPNNVHKILTKCLDYTPKNRPSIEKITETFQKLHKD